MGSIFNVFSRIDSLMTVNSFIVDKIKQLEVGEVG